MTRNVNRCAKNLTRAIVEREIAKATGNPGWIRRKREMVKEARLALSEALRDAGYQTVAGAQMPLFVIDDKGETHKCQ